MSKIIVISTSLLLSSMITLAHAADDTGTVTFNGKIINPPCEVDTTTRSQTVTFTPVGTNGFSAVGAEHAQTKHFDIKLTKCPAATKVNLTFAGDQATDSTQLKAKTGVTDTGVGIVVYGGSAGTTKVTFDDQSQAAFEQTTASEAENDLTFGFDSKLVATVTPASIVGGDFTAVTTYSIYYP